MSSRVARRFRRRLFDVDRVPLSAVEAVVNRRVHVAYTVDVPTVDFSDAVKRWKERGLE